MKKLAVVYWSGTGNTEQMAQKVADGAKAAGAEVEVLTSGAFSADQADAFEAIAFGCPAMGAEELEADEFAPMFEACLPSSGTSKLPCSAPMAGATGSGCGVGKTPAPKAAPFWPQPASCVRRPLMQKPAPPVKRWAGP